MKFSTISSIALLGAVATAAPTTTIQKRADICGQWDSVPTGSYTLYQDLWNKDAASSGSQCSGVDSLKGDTIAWHTKSVKPFSPIPPFFLVPSSSSTPNSILTSPLLTKPDP